MEAILDFLNQPVILTALSLAIGGFLLNTIAEKRTRDERRREQAIAFITEAANNINRFIPHIYGPLRSGSRLSDQEIDAALKELFSRRMSVQIGSKAYLDSDDFYERYFRILDQLAEVVICMREIDESGMGGQKLERIREGRELLRKSWPMDHEAHDEQPSDAKGELILWMDMLMARTSDLMVAYLKKVLD